MKKIRNIALLLIVFTLCFAMMCAPAHATTAQYRSTQAFIDAMDAEGYNYTVKGVDQDGDELVLTSFDTENGGIEIRFYFNDNNENTNIRVWNIIDYDTADLTQVREVLDELNGGYKFVRFYTDDYDDSVTAALDLIYRNNDVGEICLEALYYIVNIVEVALAELAPYGK